MESNGDAISNIPNTAHYVAQNNINIAWYIFKMYINMNKKYSLNNI